MGGLRPTLFVLIRADKFLRIFAQNLDLREMARKLAPHFFSFVKGARNKFCPPENSTNMVCLDVDIQPFLCFQNTR